MPVYDIKATAVCNEIALNKLSSHFGIDKKFRWGEPMLITEDNLKGVILQPEDKFVYIFHYGSIVFINLSFHEMQDIINYLKKLDDSIGNIDLFKYSEDFKFEVREGFQPEGKNANFEVMFSSAIVGKLSTYYLDIVATVLAKSVALENTENDIDALLDQIEDIIVFLDKGRLDLSDKQLAKMSGKILRFKYTTISYLLLLDKPAVVWKIEDAEEFFTELSTLFELKDRYENIRNKSETLLDITEVFTSLTHARRGTKLEWMVIILIGIEILLFGIETAASLLSRIF